MSLARVQFVPTSVTASAAAKLEKINAINKKLEGEKKITASSQSSNKLKLEQKAEAGRNIKRNERINFATTSKEYVLRMKEDDDE